MFNFQNYNFIKTVFAVLKFCFFKLLYSFIFLTALLLSYFIIPGANKNFGYILYLFIYLLNCCILAKIYVNKKDNKLKTVIITLFIATELILSDLFVFFIIMLRIFQLSGEAILIACILFPLAFTTVFAISHNQSKKIFCITLSIILFPIYYPFIAYFLNIYRIE